VILAKGFVHAICVLAAVFICSLSAAAETAAEFYKDKVVKLVVGYSAGGGYDVYARMLAPHLERRLGATVVVENRPGGGGVLALNQVSAAKPDGLTLMIISASSSAFGQVLQGEGVRYDMNRLGFLGRIVDDKRVLVFGAQSSFATFDDVLSSSRSIRFAGTARISTIAAGAAFLAEALGLEANVVVGYKGTKEVALAAIRGEVDGFLASESSARRYTRDESLTPFATIARERSALLPDVPTLFELTTLSPEQAWWIDYSDALFGLGRALVTTPDIPADRLEFLQQAVQDVLTDATVVAEATSTKKPINYAPPAAAKTMIETVMGSLTEEQLAKIRHVALERFK